MTNHQNPNPAPPVTSRPAPPRSQLAHRYRTAYRTMTVEEYNAMPVIGWHEVCRDVDGFGGVGVRYLEQPQ